MSDDVGDLALFIAIAEGAGITPAAERLRLSPAVVSRRFARIEARLGVRLAKRNARRFELTEEGRIYLARGREILKAVRDAEAEVSARGSEVHGRLRVGAPVEIGRDHVARIVGGFVEHHPGIEVHVELSDAGLELGDDALDVALRFDRPVDRSVIARPVATTPRVLCASPDYLARRGCPARPADLAHHECLRLTRRFRRVEPWLLREGGVVSSVDVGGRLSSGSGEVIHRWALAGLGIAREARWDIADDLRTGRLVEILSDHWCDIVEVFAVFQPGSPVPRRVQLFVDFVTAQFDAVLKTG